MVVCPNCLHKELVGAVFCSECGSSLVTGDGISTSTIRPSSILSEDRIQPDGPLIKEFPFPSTGEGMSICLNIMSSGKILPLNSEKEVTLGRVSEGQPIVPDVDLTPFKAYESGVSRMHASVKVVNEEVMITDLGSANGTRINGVKIASHLPHPVKHGDILTLGRFKIQVILRPETGD